MQICKCAFHLHDLPFDFEALQAHHVAHLADLNGVRLPAADWSALGLVASFAYETPPPRSRP